ncbi:MmyB family transcriptional regulator, partial [Actinosynnema sp.]|uniref:MmyB family transcriptional regulator n=1 Tax=Actinosynnema sp. TaxID=1872144 RepID=UPI003F85644A
HPEEDHALHSRGYAAQFRQACSAGEPRALEIRDALLARSPEFARVWAEHRVGEGYPGVKRFAHRELGLLELRCQTLVDPEQAQTLLVFTAEPGSESYEKLLLLAAVG